jgi:6-pyruvoyl-tetrahydropterin synthase
MPEAIEDNSSSTGGAEFEVFVGKEDFKFSAAHFVAFDGFRERLHGHNYQVAVRLKGQQVDIFARLFVVNLGAAP